MSADFWEKMSNIAANSKPAKTPSQTPYALTEILNITWSSPIDLEDASTVESQFWSQTLQACSKHSGTTQLWWGQLLDPPQAIKLIVDWTSSEHDASNVSQSMSSLPAIWERSPTPTMTSAPECYVFPSMQGYRQTAFQPPDNYFKDAVTVFITFYFAADWDSSEADREDTLGRRKKVVWDNAWSIFQQAALKSEGAWIADKSLDGWSTAALPNMAGGPVDVQKSFVGVFRFQNAMVARNFATSLADREQKQADGGLAELKRLAERAMKVEIVNMRYQSSEDD